MLTADDLLEPKGDVSPEMFPGKDAAWIDTLLSTYLADGYARLPSAVVVPADRDNAARAWAYARSYRHVLSRLSRSPASASIANEVSRTITSAQIAHVAKLAAKWEAEFDGIVGSAPTPDETPSAAATNAYLF